MRSQAGLSRAELLALPAAVPLYPTGAAALGVGRSRAYEMVKTGEWPTRVLRLGTLIRIPTAELLALLGIVPDDRPPVGHPKEVRIPTAEYPDEYEYPDVGNGKRARPRPAGRVPRRPGVDPPAEYPDDTGGEAA